MNEEDFYPDDPDATEEQRKAAYQRFVSLYIALYYEPLDEEFDEARYFTKNFDAEMVKKLRFNRASS